MFRTILLTAAIAISCGRGPDHNPPERAPDTPVEWILCPGEPETEEELLDCVEDYQNRESNELLRNIHEEALR